MTEQERKQLIDRCAAGADEVAHDHAAQIRRQRQALEGKAAS